MWCEAGFEPEAFWLQTPRHFQLAMRGVRRRLTGEDKARLRQSWWTAVFGALTQTKGGLKPLDHYISDRPAPSRQAGTAAVMEAMQILQAAGAAITMRKVPRRWADQGEGGDGG